MMDESFSCRTFRKEDEAAVQHLVETTFSSSILGGEFWNWKYLQNPGFDPALLAVAEKDGEIIGCNHWLQRRFRITSSKEVDCVLGADIAVIPECRKMGVGRALLQFLRTTNAPRKYPLMYMFANPKLRKRFHTPVSGYVPAPYGTVCYTKILNWKKVKQKASAFNEAVSAGKFGKKLSDVDLGVLFKVESAPPLVLHVGEDGVDVYEKEETINRRTDVVIAGDVTTLSGLKGKEGDLRKMLTALLTGRMKIRGKPWKMWVAYRNLWVFMEILSGKIT
jgi:predicted N-acetyltransferase YhbS